jgi:WD40 repeat protein
MSGKAHVNPFPGPQPYRCADQDRFLGREQLTRKLVNRILAHPCVTLFGPSGAGKSSLMQAGVIPVLMEAHGFRTVRVDAWLREESPLERLAQAMFTELDLGARPGGMGPREALDEALRLAEQRSERPILIYLDQLEQLLLPGRSPVETGGLLEGLEALARMPIRGLQVVLSLREDYLGRFRDRARALRFVLDQGFRLGPLTVGEMARLACRVAATGTPAQHWREEEMRALMLQVRTAGQSESDEAEVQAAFAQIVCRALWEERVAGRGPGGTVEAEPILHRYLDATLDALGPLRGAALTLLEEHLVAADGSRTLLMESQAEAALPPGAAAKVLASLEGAAVLHAEQHQGSRYFELGHDWLARKVLELKQERLRLEEEHCKARRVRAIRRKLLVTASLTGVVVAVLIFLLLLAVNARHEALNQSLLTGAREMLERGQPAMAEKLLLEVSEPEKVPEWDPLALEALDANHLQVTLPGRGLPLNRASLSPDGERIVTASSDGTARVWRASGLGEPARLEGHEDEVRTASFSPDGERIVTASADGTARVWRVSDGQELLAPLQHEDDVRSAAFSPDGERLLTVSTDGTAREWRAADGAPLRVWKVSRDGHMTVGHPDGSGDSHVPQGNGKPLSSAALSPDGESIVTTSWDKTPRVWRAGDGKPLFVLKGHTGPVQSVTFSQDGRFLVTASSDGTVRIWRAGDGMQVLMLKGHEGPVQSAAFSWDGALIVTASMDGTARVWRLVDGKELLVLKGHEGPVQSATFSRDGALIVTASWDGTARVWRARSLEMGQPLLLRGHGGPVQIAGFSHDRLVTFTRDEPVRVWRSGGQMEPLLLTGLGEQLSSVAVSADGERIATTSWDGLLRVGRADGSGVLLEKELEHKRPVSAVAFSPDGESIATASRDKTARVWRVSDGERVGLLEGHLGAVQSVAFSPDGKSIVTASRDKTARVWRTGDGMLLHELEGHESAVQSAAFSRDGRYIVTASADGTARVWRAEDGRELSVLKDHVGAVQSATFSPDGELIVTASSDGTARVWRAADGKMLLVLKGHLGPVQSAVFSPDGQSVITGSWDKTARVWLLPATRLETAQLKETLENDNQDCLSVSQRRAYLKERKSQARTRHARCERARERMISERWMNWSGSRATATTGGPLPDSMTPHR